MILQVEQISFILEVKISYCSDRLFLMHPRWVSRQMFEIDVVSNQLSFGLSPFPVIVENKGLAWEPLLKMYKSWWWLLLGGLSLSLVSKCFCCIHLLVHPRNLTWNLKGSPQKRKFLFKTIMFRFHVKFRGSKSPKLLHVLCHPPKQIPRHKSVLAADLEKVFQHDPLDLAPSQSPSMDQMSHCTRHYMTCK